MNRRHEADGLNGQDASSAVLCVRRSAGGGGRAFAEPGHIRRTHLCWDLAADERERKALLGPAEDCPDATVTYETIPADAK
ncbi:hypothetical protein [Streptomyces virginiae]|uniref:hypothetical protein n=1 Tax=Streptomyces virginiae TaxID=1961 RepID=UPI0034410E21